MNLWLRARVGLQGLTLVAIVAGSQVRKEEMARLNDEGELAQKKEEKLEFEERLKEAQATTEMEQGFSKRVVKGPAVRTEKREERIQASSSEPAANPTSAAVKQSKSWAWWGSKSGDNDSN